MVSKKATQLCAICGINLGVTKDHIPPQSLYPHKSRRVNQCLYFVRACAECNNGAAADDEAFKIIIGLATADSREDTGALLDSLAGTISKNRRLAIEVFQAEDVYAALDGTISKHYKAVTSDFKSFENVISRIAKALYWKETGRSLGKDTRVNVIPFQSAEPELLETMGQFLSQFEPKFLNDETFIYRYSINEDGSSIWGMQFFNATQTTTFAYVAAR